MKDWRREWLYMQTHQNWYERKTAATPLVRTESGYYRTKREDNIWRESQRDKIKFMKRHTPAHRATGTERVANLIRDAFFGGHNE